jgi:hypothetical protein
MPVREKWTLALKTTRESKVHLAPGGFGADTKRPYEAILVGSVPLMLRDTGLYKTYRNLPVIFKDDLRDDQAVEFEYASLVCRKTPFRFEKLVWTGWVEFIFALRDGRLTVEDW